MKYIRFIVSKVDEDSKVPIGIFHAFYDLRESGCLNAAEEKECKQLGVWFSKHLKKPSKFTTSKKPHAPNKAISWLKTDAHVHLSKMREIVSILEHHDIGVKTLMSDRPGYIVYEDQYQVIAEPFADTRVGF